MHTVSREQEEFNIWNNRKKYIHIKGKEPFFREGEIRWVSWGKNIGTEITGKGKIFSRPALISQPLCAEAHRMKQGLKSLFFYGCSI